MFQITRRADYAVRILLELGSQPHGQWTQVTRLARATGVPQAFLHKITGGLVNAGFVQTRPGPAGGLALARPAADINLLDVIQTMDGPLCLNSCLLRPHECPRDAFCPAHMFWGRLQAMIVQQLRGATLDHLVAEARALKQRPRRHPEVVSLLPDAVQVR